MKKINRAISGKLRIIKTSLIVLFFFAHMPDVNAQALQWAVGMGSADVDAGMDLTVDHDGFVLSTGLFSGTVDFDPSAGIYNLTSTAAINHYIQKMDSAGNFVWAKSIGNVDPWSAKCCIKTDLAGNIYIGGSFTSTLDFDPGPGTYNLTSSGLHDIFILKLNAAGNFIWAKKMGGSVDDHLHSIDIDANNNVYTSGGFSGLADFDPGPGNFALLSAGSQDMFISKLDSNGNFVWARSIGDVPFEDARNIHIDYAGNVLVTGSFQQTVDFDPGAGIYNLVTTSSYADIFILKLDAGGNFLWARGMGGIWHDWGNSIATDTNNNVYLTGEYKAVVDFDPGAGTFNLSANGAEDIFILKLDSTGTFVWAKGMGGSGTDLGNQIAIDYDGNIYLSARFQNSADVDPGAGVYILNTSNFFAWLISKLDMNGNFLWVKAFDYDVTDYNSSMVLHGNSIYRTSFFENTTDMDPDAGIYNLISNGVQDIYVQKYNYCGTTYNINYNACDSLILFANTYTSNFDTVLQYADVNGCDSIHKIHIYIYPSVHSYLTQTVCDSFTLNAQTYYTSGTYLQTFLNANGCDSIITLDLTVNYSGSTSILQQANGSYTLNGQTYFTSGIYTQILTNITGCDSVITLNLNIDSYTPCASDIIINSSPYVNYITESQTWIVTSGTVLIPLGTYAKLDADNNNYITLNPGFKAEHGSVFVAQAFNGCTSGAPQSPQLGKGINTDLFTANEIVLYPNPTTGMIHIQHDEKLERIQIFDMVGKLIINQKCNGEIETHIDLSNMPNGVYHVRAAGYNSIKVVKNN